ncbi:hypothetical protein GCM10010353_25430 [Streptomyces chryseus]|nr:hypothetical protein GCM10010353_25430 [Streptomyces chryseus]
MTGPYDVRRFHHRSRLMHDDRSIVEHRLRRVLAERLKPAARSRSLPLTVGMWEVPGEPVPVAEGLSAVYGPAAPGQPWGPAWGTTWFRVAGRVPDEWRGRAVEAVVDLGFDRRMPGFQCEGLVYLPDGQAVKGLNPFNDWVPVADPARGGEEVLLYVEAAANPVLAGQTPTYEGDRLTSSAEPLYRVGRTDLVVVETEVWELVQDLEVLGSLMPELAEGDARRWEILRAVERALDAVDLADVAGTAARARAELTGVLASPANASAHRVSAVGHAHIDSAWLWPLRETVRKVARTCSNVVALMDTHPEFVFAMSQAQQLAWIKDQRPEVFAKVKKKVEDGQFVPVGGMWVESDTNMVGGEAMARQFLYGKKFFLDEFGVETEEVWLPDSFGYTAAMPQLVRLSGSKWFLTQKISWSQSNTFPHHTFWWEGIDGTRVFTHFPPVDTYNSDLGGAQIAHAARNYREKGRASRSLVPFGWGDGGGGPTREMLARAERLRDLEGSARVVVESRPPSSRKHRPSTRTRRCGRASCTWSCTGAPTPRRPGPSRATGTASRCCGRRSCGRRRRRCGWPATPIRTRTWSGSGRRSCCTSSTTSCRARRSRGCTGRRGRRTRGCGRSWRSSSRPRRRRWRARGRRS